MNKYELIKDICPDYDTMCDKCNLNGHCTAEYTAKRLIDKNWHKVPEGSVLISKEEYEDLRMLEAKYGLPICMDGCITAYGHRLMTGERPVDQASKQASRDFAEKVKVKIKELKQRYHEDYINGLSDEEYTGITEDDIDKLLKEAEEE